MLERAAVAVVVPAMMPPAKVAPVGPVAVVAAAKPHAHTHEPVAAAAAAHARLAEGDLVAVVVEEAQAHAGGEVVATVGDEGGGWSMDMCTHAFFRCIYI